MSLANEEAGIGYVRIELGKLSAVSGPFRAIAATSYAAAAISGLAYVPSQMRVVLRGSRISDTHFPLRDRIPRYIGWPLGEADAEAPEGPGLGDDEES